MLTTEIKNKIDTIIEQERLNDIPGLSLLIGEKGQILYEKGYGLCDIENKLPCQVDTKYLIASITKQFACMAVMMLKEEGLLDYDDSVSKYFVEFPEWFEDITIRHLMTHTSGIPDYLNKEFINRFSTGADEDVNISEVIDIIKTSKAEFQPGADHQYCNSGYVMLHLIIEMVSGKSFEEFLEERIFIPLEMTNTLIPVGLKRIVKSAIGYKKVDEGKFERDIYNQTTIGWADGNIMSTVGDLFKWSNALESERLVKKETMKEAFKSYILTDGRSVNYGFGHFLFDGRGVNEIWHTGGTEGYRSNFKRFPDEGIVLIMLTNISPSKDPIVDQLFEKIVNLIMKNHFTTFPTITLSEKDKQKYQCRFISDKLSGEFYFNDDKLLVFEPDDCKIDRMKDVYRYIGNDVFMLVESSAVSCAFDIRDTKPVNILINHFGRCTYSKEVKKKT